MRLNSIPTVLVISLLFAILLSCKTTTDSPDTSWLADHNKWKNERVTDLKKPLGYLSMVGLYWLEEGNQTFGSDDSNDHILPPYFPENLFELNRAGDVVSLTTEQKDFFTINGENHSKSLIMSDLEDSTTQMTSGSFHWFLIKRGERYAIRLKDTLSESRLALQSIPAFDLSEDWIKEATFIPSENNDSIEILNHVGITYKSKLMGKIAFSHEDMTHQLSCTDGGDGKLFMVFGDNTNGSQSYGGGRFLFVDIPAVGDKAIMDFNKAENPICAFSDYATCPFPPAGNRLDIAINAGELKVR